MRSVEALHEYKVQNTILCCKCSGRSHCPLQKRCMISAEMCIGSLRVSQSNCKQSSRVHDAASLILPRRCLTCCNVLLAIGSYSCFPRFDPWPLDMPTTQNHRHRQNRQWNAWNFHQQPSKVCIAVLNM